ncbi:MAG: ATP-binding protein [Bryobacterales bacterium]
MPTRLRVFGLAVPERMLERRWVLTLAFVCIAILATIEWSHDFGVSLGVLYVIPVVIAATALTSIQVVGMAFLCAGVRDQFHPPLEPIETLLRFVMASMAYSSAGLLVREIFQNRQRVLLYLQQLRLETELRRKAEEQLRIMADDSPAGMLTLDVHARVIAANRAAHEMFGFVGGRSMAGYDVSHLLPAFASALELSATRHLRTSASGWAARVSGESFPVTTWFSTYGSGDGRCLAAVIVDTSEEVRDREHENLQQLREYNQLLAGAVSHEIRNMCSAISVVASNLKRLPALQRNDDFEALQVLVNGLASVASFKLHDERFRAESATVRQLLDQLRIVIEPDWADIDGEIEWDIRVPANTLVRGAPHALMQTFLNIAQNSLRAVAGADERRLSVQVYERDGRVVASFVDTGVGVQHPQDLFHPFRANADGSGLGLYVSRALMRSFSGDLVYQPTESGCRFDAILAIIRENGSRDVDDHESALSSPALHS